MNSGKLVIFSAPSGSGKTTLVHHLLKNCDLNLAFSISATSRPPRDYEQNGKDYYFLTPEAFKQRIANNEFAEWEEVYPDRFYGTLHSEIERIWHEGNHVVFDVDVVGGLNLKKQYPDKALAVFIKPPSIEELKNRLEKRGTETPESLRQRVEKAAKEMAYAGEFDCVVLNENLDEAKQELEEIVKTFIKNK